LGLLAVGALLLAAQAAAFFALRAGLQRQSENTLERMRTELGATRVELLKSTQDSVGVFAGALTDVQRQSAERQDKRLEELSAQLSLRTKALQDTVGEQLTRVDKRFESFSRLSEEKLDGVRTTVENRLTYLQEDNAKRLEQMRHTVDEKLQKTLDERLSQSFTQVSERLEQVYKGLGEMQTLASGVGDLKKVLSNVKTRGILGEIQLGAILEQILSPGQYEANVVTKKGTANMVEFAVRLPGDGEGEVYLPIDAKFPADMYAQLMDAYDSGDAERVAQAGTALERRVKGCAKDIRDKYVCPPATTDFAIMFLPTEGLSAEVIRRGMLETLSRDYKVNVTGPSTMAALLNSLQMGFRTLAIQKRSGEVWEVLGAVKTEFSNFRKVLESAQDRMRKANEELDKLVGVRTRAIERKLRSVEETPAARSRELLEMTAFSAGDDLSPDGEEVTM
jgi:DNA recombination protein RmuC